MICNVLSAYFYILNSLIPDLIRYCCICFTETILLGLSVALNVILIVVIVVGVLIHRKRSVAMSYIQLYIKKILQQTVIVSFQFYAPTSSHHSDLELYITVLVKQGSEANIVINYCVFSH